MIVEDSSGIVLEADEHAKMSSYDSLYSPQYLLAKFDYESRRKKWKILIQGNNQFKLHDSNNVVSHVYFSLAIKNCSCQDFIESETGSCPHLYAIENNRFLFRSNSSNGKIIFTQDNKVIFVDYPNGSLARKDGRIIPLNVSSLEELKTQFPDYFMTSAVENFFLRRASKVRTKIPVDLGDFSLFQEQKIYPYDHQKPSIKEMLEEKRTILTLKMGLGKTICALYCTKVLSDKQKIIIICPSTLKFQWKKEIDRFKLGSSLVISKGSDLQYLDPLKAAVRKVAGLQQTSIISPRFLIISYEMLNRHSSLLLNHYDIAIVDEIQKIKNGESKTWETIALLKAEYIFSLSGTPIQNNVTDLISILKVISPQEFSPDWKFYATYCSLSKTRITGWNPQTLPKLKEKLKRYIINPPINWSNFKLPKKETNLISCQMDAAQKEVHDPAWESAKILLSKSFHYPLSFKEKAILNSLLLKCRRAVSDSRLVEGIYKSDRFTKIEDLILQKVKEGEKVVVYSEWIDCLLLLIPRLKQENIKYVTFTGQLTDKAKNKNLEAFTSDPEIQVFLSTDSGGLGVDGLQLASRTVIHVEDIWNPAKLEQRNGRLVRALQPAEQVDIYYFESSSGIEEMMKANKEGKYKIINEINQSAT